jgi:hypothetical protein
MKEAIGQIEMIEKVAEIDITRVPEVDEFEQLWTDYYKYMEWYRKNGYYENMILPASESFLELERTGPKEEDKEKYRKLFHEIYIKPEFAEQANKAMEFIKMNERKIQAAFSRLKGISGFELLPKYSVQFMSFGTAGGYGRDQETGIAALRSDMQNHTKTNYITAIHEFVHVGIEETIVKKYQLEHWEKERIVDLIMSKVLSDICRGVELQSRGEAKIDEFLSGEKIYNLEENIKKYKEAVTIMEGESKIEALVIEKPRIDE